MRFGRKAVSRHRSDFVVGSQPVIRPIGLRRHLDDRVYANIFEGDRHYRLAINPDASAGAITKLQTSAPTLPLRRPALWSPKVAAHAAPADVAPAIAIARILRLDRLLLLPLNIMAGRRSTSLALCRHQDQEIARLVGRERCAAAP